MRNYNKLFEGGLDAVLVISEKNRQYFTEFASTYGYLVLLPDHVTFVTDSRYFEMAQCLVESGIDVKCIQSGVTTAMQLVKQALTSANAKTVGFEDTELTVADYKALSTQLSNYDLQPCGTAINTVRETKDATEIEYIIKAQAATDGAFADICKFIKAGMSEIDIAVELEYRLAKNGGIGLAFDTIIASGTNSSKPHAHPTNKLIEMGDPVTMDFGARYHGYCSDMTRTVFVGEPTAEMSKIYNTVLQAQQNAISNAYTGMTGGELDALAREVIVANGYGEYFTHSTGHSLGIDIHESPRASKGVADKLSANMIVTVEPGIYVPNVGGVRIEDMILFQQDEVIDLTNSPKNIIIL